MKHVVICHQDLCVCTEKIQGSQVFAVFSGPVWSRSEDQLVPEAQTFVTQQRDKPLGVPPSSADCFS